MAQPGVRTDLSRRLRQRVELIAALDRYFHFYNHRRPHLALWLTHAGRFVPAPVNKEKVIAMMGGSGPQAPQDLTHFSFRVDGFCLALNCDFRTTEGLDREDRATQGCDPSADPSPVWIGAFGPPSGQAAALSKKRREFVQAKLSLGAFALHRCSGWEMRRIYELYASWVSVGSGYVTSRTAV